MTETLSRRPRVLAVDPTTKGFAYTVFEGPASLIDWGLIYIERRKRSGRTLRLTKLIEPEALPDGLRIDTDILTASGTQVVPGALGIPAVALTGTSAHSKVQGLTAGSIVRFHAVIRMRLATVLDQVSSTAKEIKLPVEFVLLDLE